MAVISLAALAVILFAAAWRTRQTAIELAAYLLCAMGLVLYVLAFFGLMGVIDWLLLAAGAASVFWMARAVRAGGRSVLARELKRQLLDPYLWGCVLLLAVMCVCLHSDRILEWDAYNFWGPDIKSLYFREGFASKYSNVAQGFGDYSPVFQIIMWWFVHVLGSYQEQYIFYGYFIFSSLMLFSAAAVFRNRYPRGRWFTWLLVPLCALCVPGVSSTALYRTICVDPIMAILFGMILCKIVMRPREQTALWKAQLLVATGCLALLKGIGILWSVLAGIFFLLWWLREKREWRFCLALLGGPALLALSWSVYCRVMERSGYLASGFLDRAIQRLTEVANGTFLESATTRGYIRSYIQAFFVTPVHRESTLAIDLSPFAIIVLLVCGTLLLRWFGAIPQRKLKRLLAYILGITCLIYLVVSVGQLTMFYDETQYFEPLNAVTLMSRYCEPANTGLVMLVASFATGAAPGASLRHLRAGRQWLLGAVTALVLLSCTSYTEAYRRFIYDDLDDFRIEHRANFTHTYQDFIEATAAVPYWESGARVLMVLSQEEMNPIVVNEVSPVSFSYIYLNQGGEADYTSLLNALEQNHCGYLYLKECADSLLDFLPPETHRGQLYRVKEAEEGILSLEPCG